MVVTSSRTPEGEPLYCDVCHELVLLETTLWSGDATCPSCGTLVWSKRAPVGYWNGESIGQVKLPIEQLVNQLMAICRRSTSRDSLLAEFAGPLAAAMAAHGVCIWEVNRDQTLREAAFVGDISDCELFQSQEHLELVQSAKSHQAVAVLPKGSLGGATNESPFLLLLARLPLANQHSLVVEVFLSPPVSEVTQRGYVYFFGKMMRLLRSARAMRRRNQTPPTASRITRRQWTAWIRALLGLEASADGLAGEPGRRLVVPPEGPTLCTKAKVAAMPRTLSASGLSTRLRALFKIESPWWLPPVLMVAFVAYAYWLNQVFLKH